MLIKTAVNIVNTKVWTNPTKISSPNMGNEKKEKNTGSKNVIIASKTSPAKILPNKRKENEIILANSCISSRIPTKKFTGLETFIMG